VQELIATRQGCRIATSNGGVLTGRGADIILIDDPLKPEEALSDAQRQAANDWLGHTPYSRLNDKLNSAIDIIMHPADGRRVQLCRTVSAIAGTVGRRHAPTRYTGLFAPV
jgi:hypothetical protein